jgi:hypothetical protein
MMIAMPRAARACLAPVACAVALAASASAAVPIGTFAGCPRSPQPLPPRLASYEPQVRAAVLAFVRTDFLKYAQSSAAQLADARVRSVILVRRWLPSGWIRTECGVAAWRRSVAVDVYFPHLDRPHNPVGHCNACAHLTFIAARTARGWSVWGRY